MREVIFLAYFYLFELLLASCLEHIGRADIEVQRSQLVVIAIDILVADIHQAMLEAQKELPLVRQLDTRLIVKTEVKTLVHTAEDILLELRAANILRHRLAQNTQTYIGAQATHKRHSVGNRITVAERYGNLDITQVVVVGCPSATLERIEHLTIEVKTVSYLIREIQLGLCTQMKTYISIR